MERISQFYQWGDYDSLITYVPQMLEQEDSLPDSRVSALYQYLAIAQYVQGDSLAAKSFFLRAMEADTLYVLHPHYQSETSTAFFKSLKPRAEPDSIPDDTLVYEGHPTEVPLQPASDTTSGSVSLDEPDTSDRPAFLDRPEPPPAPSRFRRTMPYVLWGLSAAFTTLSVVEYQLGNKNHRRLQEAAKDNDMDRYKELQRTVQLNDRLTIAFAAAGLSSLIAGSVWFLLPTGDAEQTAVSPQWNIVYQPAGVRLQCQWPLD